MSGVSEARRVSQHVGAGRRWIVVVGLVALVASLAVTRPAEAFSPGQAVLTNDALTVAGSAEINGDVHTNQSLTVQGAAATINGTATQVPPDPMVSIPPFVARDFYGRSSMAVADWYDLCPDGTVRHPGATPCTGAVRPTTGGWTLDGTSWRPTNSGHVGGVFYVFEGNVRINPSNIAAWQSGLGISIIVEDDGACTNPQQTGNIRINGSSMVPYFSDGVMLVADRDIELLGNMTLGQPARGAFVGAVEQFEMRGTTTLHGVLVGRDAQVCPGAPVQHSEVSGNATINHAPVTVAFPPPTITVTKTPSAATVADGDTVTFTVTVTNTSSPARSVTLTGLADSDYGDLLDAANAAVTANTCSTTDPAIAAGGTFTCSFDAVVNPPHTNTVTAEVTDDFGRTGTGQGSAVVNLAGAPAFIVTKTPDPAELPSVGGDVEFTVTVENISGADIEILSLDDDVYGDLINGPTVCAPVPPSPLPNLATYTCTFTAFVDPAVADPHTNEVTATVEDTATGVEAIQIATAEVTFRDALDVRVSKTPSASTVPTAGGPITYEVTVTNLSDRAVFVDSLLDQVTGQPDLDLLDPATPDTTCNDPLVMPTSLPGIAAGATATCEFTVTVSGSPGFVHMNTVEVRADDGQGDTDTDSDGAAVTVSQPGGTTTPSANLTLTKTASPIAIGVDGSSTFTILVRNQGPSAASAVTVSDTVPTGLSIDSVSTTQGSCETVGQQVTCAIGTLGNQSTATVTIDVTAEEEGTFRNVAVVTSPTPGSSEDDRTDEAEVEVEALPIAGDCVTLGAGGNGIGGPTRIETAIEASQAVFCDGDAAAVVLTRSDLFPDAQAGTPLAIARNAPLLLSQPAELNVLTEAEILRVLPPGGTVYLLGGTVALSQAVEDRITELGYVAVRYGGENRFGTAAIIADDGLDNPATLLAANGEDFPDSVLAGAASNAGGLGALAAVILTAGDIVPPETTAYLTARADDPAIIAIGAPAAIAMPDVESVGSADRFDTSVAVAERFFTNPRVVGIATGVDFADALTGSSLIGRSDIGPGPMLLTNPGDLPATVSQYIAANRAAIRGAVIFGGVAAIDTSVRDEIRMILDL